MIYKLIILNIFMVCTLFASTSQKDVLVISTTMGKASQGSKMSGFEKIAQTQGLEVDYKFDSEIKKEKQIETLNKYKIIIFDSLSGPRGVTSLIGKYEDAIAGSKKETITIPISVEKDNINRKNITLEANKDLNLFWQNGGESNFINMSKYIKMNLLKVSKEEIGKAIIIPKEGLYHPKNPDLSFETLKDFAKFFNIDLKKNTKPIIGIGLHRGSIVSGALTHIDTMINYIESQGAQALPYYVDITGDDPVGMNFLTDDNKTIVDAIINFQIMIIDHEKQKKMYEKINVPILHALYYSAGDIEAWEKDPYGVAFPMIPMTYIIPETLGFTDALMVAAQDQKTKKMLPIMPQIESLANKAINISKLKRMGNKDKKVTIMYYNYPYGKDNMGASFLNIPESLELVLKEFKKQGYTTSELNASDIREKATAGLEALYDVNLYANASKMIENGSAALFPYEEYMKEFYKLPVDTRTGMIKHWGYPLESKSLVYKDDKWYFLVPRIEIGNIVLMPQPSRAEREVSIRAKNMDISRDSGALWHNPTVHISHAYLAGYLYARNKFKTDAFVHFGTHGTQEWSPGKERGLRVGDDALSVLGDVPVVYPYITNNLAEGIQAKRRGRATLISHQTPPFGLTGTYKELSEIMDFINQYKSVDDGMLKGQLKEQITNTTTKMNIHKDVEYSEENIAQDFDAYLTKVEDFILGSSKQAMPLGMHTFGTYPKDEHLISTIMQMVGSDFIAKVEGDEKYFAKNYKEFNSSKTYKLLDQYVINEKDLKQIKDEEIKEYLKLAIEYKYKFINTKEIKNFIRALDGEYIEGGVGGDSIRNPDSLPTGVNMYGFDPSKVPTKAAYKTGSKLMKDFIANYYKEHGKYPQKLTFNLWSLETMRHHGVLESQILYAMGVRPIWNESGIPDKFVQDMAKGVLQSFLPKGMAEWIASFVTANRVKFILDLTPDDMMQKPKKMFAHALRVQKGQITDVEIIPYSELKRPRVDVVISATGLYRDTFPQTMKMIAEAVKKVSGLKEEHNYLRQNSLALKQKLEKRSDINSSEAEYLSTIRIFSNKTGDYGSGVDAINETGRWDTDKRISQNYVQKLGYYFGSDVSRWSEKKVDLDLYSQNLSGTEGIIFSRTSNLYGLLTSDDPFEYFGSIAMAIRNVDGKAPKTFIANLRDPNDAKIESTAKFMSKELRGRYFHPKWIEEMQKEGYSGTLTVLDRMNNFWGWQVVDPNVVRDDQWQEFTEIYVNDKYDMKIDEWFKSLNPDAYARFVERILEANRKGYFKTDEMTLKKLIELYKELETKHAITKTYNEKFKEFVDKKAVGFGLMTPAGKMIDQAAAELPKQAKAKAEPTVKGQKLEKQEPKTEIKDNDLTTYYLVAFMALIMLSGVFYELRRKEV